jgi:hypothetical protein
MTAYRTRGTPPLTDRPGGVPGGRNMGRGAVAADATHRGVVRSGRGVLLTWPNPAAKLFSAPEQRNTEP